MELIPKLWTWRRCLGVKLFSLCYSKGHYRAGSSKKGSVNDFYGQVETPLPLVSRSLCVVPGPVPCWKTFRGSQIKTSWKPIIKISDPGLLVFKSAKEMQSVTWTWTEIISLLKTLPQILDNTQDNPMMNILDASKGLRAKLSFC